MFQVTDTFVMRGYQARPNRGTRRKKRNKRQRMRSINQEAIMADDHQTNAIIATAILDSLRDHPDHKLDPEEAKIIAKRILTALEDAGLQITLVDQS
jgi:hypothetical protein